MSAAVTLPEPPFPDDDAAPALRTCDEDGTHHFSHVKKIAKSGQQYLHAVNVPFEPSTPMLIGTVAHLLILGPRPGAAPPLRFAGERRQGKVWDSFREANPDAEILTAPEWEKAERIAESVLADPVAMDRLRGAKFETPLVWEDNGLKCSTSGVDIITAADALGDLKTTSTVEPDAWARLAFKMHYPQSLAWYRRGARANGITCNGGLFLLGVESVAPYEVVDLDLTEGMIDFADKCVSLWLERLRVYTDSIPTPRKVKDWPGYAQSRVPMDVPAWMQSDDEDEDADV